MKPKFSYRNFGVLFAAVLCSTGCDATLGISAIGVLAGALGAASSGGGGCTPAPPINLSATASQADSLTDQTVTFTTTAQDICRLPISYAWKINGEVVPGTAQMRFVFDRPGTYLIDVEAKNTAGLSASTTITHTVNWTPFEVEWVRRIGMINESPGSTTTEGNAVQTLPDGNVLVAGRSGCGGCHNPEQRGSINNQLALGNNAFLAKYDATGRLMQLSLLGNTPNRFQEQQAKTLRVNSAGNVLVGGEYSGTNSNFFNGTPSRALDGFVEYLNADGELLWSRVISGPGQDTVQSITTRDDSAIYVVGNSNATLDGLASQGEYDFFISQFSTDGERLNTFRYGGRGIDLSKSIKIDRNGNLYVIGDTNSPDFFPNESLGDFDIFISKINSSGVIIWSKRLGGTGPDSGFDIALNEDETHIYVAGRVTKDDTTDAYLAKIDSEGALVWEKRITGSGADVITGLVPRKNGGVIAIGTSSGSELGEYSNLPLKNKIFIAKFLSDGTGAPLKVLSSDDGEESSGGITENSDGSFIATGSSSGSALDGAQKITNNGTDSITVKFRY